MPRILYMTAVCLAASSWTTSITAQTIYRCGDSYSQQRCPGGIPVQADDARSASQRSQTREAVQRDAKAAEAMEKTRLKDEAVPAQAVMPPSKAEEAPPEEREKVVNTKAKKPAYFTAVSPKAAKKKKKAKKKSA